MTLLRAGEAPRSDGEAMSTGSELSEEGSDGMYGGTSSMPPSPGQMSTSSSLTSQGMTSPGLMSPDVGYTDTYEANVAHILVLHRALAQTYNNTGRKMSPHRHALLDLTQSCPNGTMGRANIACHNSPMGRTYRALSADLGLGYLRSKALISEKSESYNNHQNYVGLPQQHHSWGSDPEPTSPTPSDGSSTASGTSVGGNTSGGTPRGKNFKFNNLTTISETVLRPDASRDARNSLPIGGFRPRTSSTSGCVSAHAAAMLGAENDDGAPEDADSDDDDDDYGFLSHYSGLFVSPTGDAVKDKNGHNNNGHIVSPTGMHKSKSPAAPRRLLPKRWRKPKWTPSKESPVPWTPEGSCAWTSGSGRKVTLTPTSLVNLCNVERLCLQKINVAKLQAMGLGCAITIPKDGSSQKRSKRSTFSLKRKTNSDSSGWVFGIPLAKVTANDLQLRHRKPSSLRERRESLDLAQRHTRKSSSSSVSRSSQLSCQQSLISLSVSSSLELLRAFHQPTGAMSSDSLSETDSRSTGGAGSTQGSVQGSNLIDALSLSSSAKLESSWREQRESLAPHTPVVPFLVNTCCKHLEIYGLNVLGIFRIGSSKKRIKQLREEFDCGRDVKLNEDHNPHDVGALLKEFCRDLPDPLLTRDLYNAFLATRKLPDESQRVQALSMLVSLLPAINRDTFWALLTFLAMVVSHSADTVDEHGNTVSGNKMDSHNLATLFGPNIMHKAKGGEFEVTSVEHAEERHDIISVVKEMIDQHTRLFEVSAELHDEVIRLLMDTNPESADYILRRKCALSGVELDPETSSSFYEESDNSSLPPTPGYNAESDNGRSRTLVDGSPAKAGNSTISTLEVASQDTLRSRSSRSLGRTHRAEPPPQLEMLKIPQFRISSPDQGWYRPDSRSPSPMSPRISPSPKAMKSATPDQRMRGVSEAPRERCLSTNSLISPRPVRFKHHLTLNASIPTTSPSTSSSHTLTVPCGGYLKRDRDSDSSTSLSSYYPSTSRSATNSPITPDAPHSWSSMNTPPASPRSPPGNASEQATGHEARTSSRQRPLGVNLHVTSRKTSSSSEEATHPLCTRTSAWQKERWKRWEMLAKEHSDEFQEQETLV